MKIELKDFTPGVEGRRCLDIAKAKGGKPMTLLETDMGNILCELVKDKWHFYKEEEANE